MPDDDRSGRGREDDRAFMRRALDLAERGWGQTAPNPLVGAVVVEGDAIVGEGYHAGFGESHAEVVALAAAAERARGATLYVTLEPCTHHGRTPPCTDAILAAGIARVVIATRDPNPRAAGGAEVLRAAGVAVDTGVEEVRARELNAGFLHGFASDRPFVILKLAVSVDGAIADAAREPGTGVRWLTGPESRRAVHHLRAGADAVGVGIGTVLADDPRLTVRDVPAPRVPPRRVVFDRSARLPLTSALARTAREVPTLIVACAETPSVGPLRDAGVDVRIAPTLRDAFRMLAADGVRTMLVEGGALLAGSLLTDGLVDRLIIFEAPILLGAGAIHAFGHVPTSVAESIGRLRVVERRSFGDDVMTTYAFGAT